MSYLLTKQTTLVMQEFLQLERWCYSKQAQAWTAVDNGDHERAGGASATLQDGQWSSPAVSMCKTITKRQYVQHRHCQAWYQDQQSGQTSSKDGKQ